MWLRGRDCEGNKKENRKKSTRIVVQAGCASPSFLDVNNRREADWGLEGNWGVEIALIMRERL